MHRTYLPAVVLLTGLATASADQFQTVPQPGHFAAPNQPVARPQYGQQYGSQYGQQPSPAVTPAPLQYGTLPTPPYAAPANPIVQQPQPQPTGRPTSVYFGSSQTRPDRAPSGPQRGQPGMTAHQTTAHPPQRQGGPAAHGQPVVGPQGAMLPHGVPGYAPQVGVGVQLGVGAQPQLPTAPANQQPPVTSRQVPPTPMTNDPQAPDPRVQRYFASLAGPNLSHGNQNYHGRSDFGQTRSGQVTLSGQASPLQSRIGQSRWGLSTFNQTQVGQNQRNYSQHLMRAPDRLTNKTDALLLP